MTTDTHYASCTEEGCGLKFESREEASAHSSETMNAAKAANPTATYIAGHGFRVDNPTPEEQRVNRVRSRVGWAVETAREKFIREIERGIDRGDVTIEEVTAEMRGYSDFSDAWDEFVAEVSA